MTPKFRPQQSRKATESLLAGVKAPVTLVGVRGYYSNTFAPQGNNYNVYDDALFLISDHGYFSFNANVDPSVRRPGIAKLKPGVWQYRVGTHNISKSKSKQYQALVQAAPVTVIREGQGEDTGWFGINIHRGGRNTTGSLGCVTLPGSQFDGFLALVKGEMSRAKVSRIPFVLTENA
jgi:hypothetical protein